MTTLHPMLSIKQDTSKSIPVELLASSLMTISEGIKRLRKERLNDRALFLLIQNAAPKNGPRSNSPQITLQEIQCVIEGLERLEETFIRKPEPKETKKK